MTVDAATIVLSPAAGALPGGTAGTAYSQTVSASGGIASYSFAITSGSLPAGLTLSSAGILSGTPTASGTFIFTVTGTDSSAGTGPYSNSNAYSMTIAVPTLTLAPAAGALPAGTAGTVYNQTFTASNGGTPYSYSVTAGTLPSGLTLSAAGVLSGTPDTEGAYSFDITATDTYGATTSLGYSLVINVQVPVANAVTLTVAANASAQPVTLNITGGAASTVAVATAASHGTATASGTAITYEPAAGYSGMDTFTYTASNTSGTSSPATVTVSVTSPAITLSPASGTLPAGTVGKAYSGALTASNGTAPYTFTITAGSLSAGLTLDGATGTIGGTPTAAGSFGFTITATDAYGATGSATYDLVVKAPVGVFTFTPPAGSLGETMAGEDYSQQITATGGTAPLLYSLASGKFPDGMVLNVSTGKLSGLLNADSDGNYSFTIAVRDNSGATGSATYSLNVKPREVTAPNFVVDVPAGGSPTDVYLNDGATGGPFTSADIISVEPANAGTAKIIRGQVAQAAPISKPVGWYLQFSLEPRLLRRGEGWIQPAEFTRYLQCRNGHLHLHHDAQQVAEEIDALVRGFVETRQDLIANGIYVPGLLERRQMGQATDSVTARMTPSEDGMTANFSTSLAQMDAARDRADGIEGAMSPRSTFGSTVRFCCTSATRTTASGAASRCSILAPTI